MVDIPTNSQQCDIITITNM